MQSLIFASLSLSVVESISDIPSFLSLFKGRRRVSPAELFLLHDLLRSIAPFGTHLLHLGLYPTSSFPSYYFILSCMIFSPYPSPSSHTSSSPRIDSTTLDITLVKFSIAFLEQLNQATLVDLLVFSSSTFSSSFYREYQQALSLAKGIAFPFVFLRSNT